MGRKLFAWLAGGAIVAVTLIITSAVSAGGTPPCTGRDLSGTFSAVRGSAGAGQISYNLRLRNRTTRACFVSGIPGLRLVDRAGRLLPTHVAPAHPGQLTAVRVVLRPGGYVAATARFSPDVPGVGEPVGKTCERTAYRMRISPPPGGGVTIVPVVPPTPVCEHGGMQLSVLVAGRNGPAHA
jgi:hypothetical protein